MLSSLICGIEIDPVAIYKSSQREGSLDDLIHDDILESALGQVGGVLDIEGPDKADEVCLAETIAVDSGENLVFPLDAVICEGAVVWKVVGVTGVRIVTNVAVRGGFIEDLVGFRKRSVLGGHVVVRKMERWAGVGRGLRRRRLD